MNSEHLLLQRYCAIRNAIEIGHIQEVVQLGIDAAPNSNYSNMSTNRFRKQISTVHLAPSTTRRSRMNHGRKITGIQFHGSTITVSNITEMVFMGVAFSMNHINTWTVLLTVCYSTLQRVYLIFPRSGITWNLHTSTRRWCKIILLLQRYE